MIVCFSIISGLKLNENKSELLDLSNTRAGPNVSWIKEQVKLLGITIVKNKDTMVHDNFKCKI